MKKNKLIMVFGSEKLNFLWQKKVEPGKTPEETIEEMRKEIEKKYINFYLKQCPEGWIFAVTDITNWKDFIKEYKKEHIKEKKVV